VEGKTTIMGHRERLGASSVIDKSDWNRGKRLSVYSEAFTDRLRNVWRKAV